jgi:hypothetical protein
LKDRFGDQRGGGGEWEPIKILLQRENSAYAPNSQPRIPTQVCQGHVVTMDLPTLGTNPKQPQSESTNQEAKDLAALQYTRQTIRGLQADRPRGYGGPYASCDGLSKKRSPITSTAPSITDCPRWANGPSAPPRTVRHSSTDRLQTSCHKNPPTKRIKQKTRKNSRRTRKTLGLSGSSRTVCHVPARPRTVRQEEILQPELDPLKVNSTFPLPDLPNQPRDCYQIIGEDEASLGDALPTNL